MNKIEYTERVMLMVAGAFARETKDVMLLEYIENEVTHNVDSLPETTITLLIALAASLKLRGEDELRAEVQAHAAIKTVMAL